MYRNDGGSFVDIVAGLPLEIQGAQRRGINCWIRVDMDGAQSETLDEAITFGMGQKEWFEHDSDLDPVREHPRFQALLERL